MSALSDDNLKHLQTLVDLPDLSNTKYELVERLDRGGMGTVYKVHDSELDRMLCLKVLTVPDDSGLAVRRMLTEAQILARLEHPSIVPIHDSGKLPDQRMYYTMKLVQGKTLTQWLTDNPTERERLRIFQQVCQAMAFAHAREVIHRDIKPENIMVGEFGEVLLMDWGVAKVLSTIDTSSDSLQSSEATTTTVTSHGAVIGTLAYMSPEQASGETDKIDKQSDIYMLGATLFFLLTDQPPYQAIDPETLKAQFAKNLPIDPRTVKPSIKKPLAAICLKAMARDKTERYTDPLKLSSDIGHFLENEPLSAYRENLLEKSSRWLGKNRFIVYILVTYIICRALIFFWLGR